MTQILIHNVGLLHHGLLHETKHDFSSRMSDIFQTVISRRQVRPNAEAALDQDQPSLFQNNQNSKYKGMSDKLYRNCTRIESVDEMKKAYTFM